MHKRQIDALADNPLDARDRRADQGRSQFQNGIVVEFGGEPLLGQVDTVSLDARETDLEGVAIGTYGLHGDGLAGRLRGCDDGLGVEVEGNTEDVGVFDIEEAGVVEVVGLAAQGAADHLFAEKLGAEGAHPQDVSYGIGVPAFGEHRNGDDAADGLAQAAGLADGVHHFAEDLLVGEVLSLLAIAGALDDFAPEALDLGTGDGAEVVVEGVAGFDLFAIDEQGVGAGDGVAVVVEIAEEGQAAGDVGVANVFVSAKEAGDVIEDELGGRGVVADHDEAGGNADAGLFPECEGFVVVAVEGFEGGHKLGGQAQGVEILQLSAAFARHFGTDVLPEIAEDGYVGARDVIGHGDAGEFDDAALDGVHEREVAHGPVKESAFVVARAAQEEGRRGQVKDAGDAQLAVDGFEAGDPEAGLFVTLLGFLFLFALEVALVFAGLLTIAVMGFVVKDQDVLDAHEAGHDALDHLAFGFEGTERLAAALQQVASTFGDLQALAEFEGVVVGDDDLGVVQVGKQVAGHEFAAGVVAVGVIGLEDAEAVADGESGGDDQEAAGETGAAGAAQGVDGLPGDEHRHDGGFARASGKFEGDAEESGIGLMIGVGQVIEESFAGLARVGGDFGEPDGNFDGLDLAEERPDVIETVTTRVLQEARGFGSDFPVGGVGEATPQVYVAAQFGDDG